MTDQRSCKVLICGGGPAGLAALLICLKRGWKDIVLVERRNSPHDFEPGKTFNYQLDGRGQLVLEQTGVDEQQLSKYGLPNDSFTLTSYSPDGTAKTASPPILMPDRKTPYWTVRPNLLTMLNKHAQAQNHDGYAELLYSHRIESLITNSDGSGTIEVSNDAGEIQRFKPELILGCDGLNSPIRNGLKKLLGDGNRDFAMHQHPSPSAKLKYKVLQFPAKFDVAGVSNAVDNHEMAYAFLSTYKSRNKKLALFALPVASVDQQRTINIILPEDHEFWKLNDVQAVMSFLAKGFPQLDFDKLISPEEAKAFAERSIGQFPEPQYSTKIHAEFKMADQSQNILLVGDAARAFPPDLGMGVNAALEDIYILDKELDASNDNISAACSAFEKRRLPENRSLVRLVQKVHPYQYNQVPWRLKLWILRFSIQFALHKISGGLVYPPGFVLSQYHQMNFAEMERRYNRGNQIFYAFILVTLIIPGLFLLSML